MLRALAASMPISNRPLGSEREAWIDAARGLAIVLVIIGHAMEPMFYHRSGSDFSQLALQVWKFVYAAHVPALLLIAGRVRNPESIAASSGRRSPTQLIALAFVWHVLGVVLLFVMAVVREPSLQTVRSLPVIALRPLILGTGFSLAPLWFLLTLGCVEMIWSRLRGRPAVLTAVAIGLSLIAIIAPYDMPNFWGFKTLGPALIFYALGATLRSVPKRWFVWTLGLSVCTWIAAAAANRGCLLPSQTWCALEGFHGQFGVFMAIGRYGFYPLFLFAALAGSLAILGLGVLLSRAPLAKFWVWAGRSSLELYLINALVLTAINPLLRASPLSGNDLQLVAVVAAVSVLAQALVVKFAGPVMAYTRVLAAHLAVKLVAPPTDRLAGS